MALTVKPVTELQNMYLQMNGGRHSDSAHIEMQSVGVLYDVYLDLITSENTHIHIAGAKIRGVSIKPQLEFQKPAAHMFGGIGKSLLYHPTLPK